MSPEMNRKTVRLPDDLLDDIEWCVETGDWPNDSELIRDAIREKVRSEIRHKRRKTPTRMRGGGSR
jgi:Arc/MetJ-type ribon-helix-helix transcriptional regulator